VAALSLTNNGRSVTGMSGYIAPAATATGSGASVDPLVSGRPCAGTGGSVTFKDALGRTIVTDVPLRIAEEALAPSCRVE
jgi:hypothetical protein